MYTQDEIPYCVDGCGREATVERFAGVLEDAELVEVADLVCVYCYRADDLWVDLPFSVV